MLRRLLSDCGSRYLLGAVLVGHGFGYLRRTLRGWNNAAKGSPWIVLTDLDRAHCPASLLRSWLDVPKHPNLLFRVAVTEVESWLLADRVNLAKFLGVSPGRIPESPDRLSDPKRALVGIAGQAKASVRHRLVPRPNSTAQQGPDYNSCLVEFVAGIWDAGRAAQASPSLSRTMDRLQTFQPI